MSQNERCYGSPREKKSWEDARNNCMAIADGYDLVSIASEEENKFVMDKVVLSSKGENFWIGLKENGQVGQYAWVDSSPFEFGSQFDNEIWAKDEPNQVIYLILFEIIKSSIYEK